MSDDLVARAEIVIAADRETVWRSLVDPDLVGEYMPGTTVRSTWAEGAEVTWSGEWEGKPFEDHGRVLAAEPGERLTVTHVSGGGADEDGHVVTYDLAETDDRRTRLRVAQENNPNREMVEQSEQTWQQVLEGIRRTAERAGVSGRG